MTKNITPAVVFIVVVALWSYAQQGTVTVEIPRCSVEGEIPTWSSTAGKFVCAVGSNGTIPSGTIVMRDSGSCGAGWTEIGEMAGRMPLGTTVASGDLATLGGSDSVNAVLDHTHAVNVSDSGHNHTQSPHSHIVTSQTATTGAATSYEHGVLDTSSAEAEATEVTGTTTAMNNPSVTGISATTANPAGSVASFDNRSAYRRVIFCRKQ